MMASADVSTSGRVSVARRESTNLAHLLHRRAIAHIANPEAKNGHRAPRELEKNWPQNVGKWVRNGSEMGLKWVPLSWCCFFFHRVVNPQHPKFMANLKKGSYIAFPDSPIFASSHPDLAEAPQFH